MYLIACGWARKHSSDGEQGGGDGGGTGSLLGGRWRGWEEGRTLKELSACVFEGDGCGKGGGRQHASNTRNRFLPRDGEPELDAFGGRKPLLVHITSFTEENLDTTTQAKKVKNVENTKYCISKNKCIEFFIIVTDTFSIVFSAATNVYCHD